VKEGQPRIKGVYVLFDEETLAPAAILDGIGLTDVRTAAGPPAPRVAPAADASGAPEVTA